VALQYSIVVLKILNNYLNIDILQVEYVYMEVKFQRQDSVHRHPLYYIMKMLFTDSCLTEFNLAKTNTDKPHFYDLAPFKSFILGKNLYMTNLSSFYIPNIFQY
jgi:hypothetical protein